MSLRENCKHRNQDNGNCLLIGGFCTSVRDDICPTIAHKLNKLPLINRLIELAKNKYPISITYTGRFTGNDMSELEKVCDVYCFSVYMNGSGSYLIRYRNDEPK